MTARPGYASNLPAATHLEFILADSPPNLSDRIRPNEKLALLRAGLAKAYPFPAAADFDDLLMAVDEADEGRGMRLDQGETDG